MNIGFDAKRLYHNFTGLGNYSRFVVEALVESFPAENYFLFSPKLRKHPETIRFLEHSKVRNITASAWINQFGLGSYWRSYRIGSLLSKSNIQVYHGLSNELPRRIPSGIKKVVTIHDLIFLRFPEYYKAIDIKIYNNKVKHACREADVIIAISQQTKKDIISFLGVDPHKIFVVHMGFHQNFRKAISNEEQARVLKKYNLPDKYILFVGTLEPRKNAKLIVEALSEIPQYFHLVLVGRSTSYIKDIASTIDKYKLTERVHIRNRVSFEDLPYVYQHAEVFVYPSFFEGFGIPLIEAIQCKVPVIAATGSCLEEAGGPSSIYINPHHPEELSAAILQVLSNTGRKEEMVENSLKYIEKFEPGVIAQQLMDIYRQ